MEKLKDSPPFFYYTAPRIEANEAISLLSLVQLFA